MWLHKRESTETMTKKNLSKMTVLNGSKDGHIVFMRQSSRPMDKNRQQIWVTDQGRRTDNSFAPMASER
jgi:hypothetical protein